MLKNFWKDESGQDLVEYALTVGIVSLGALAGLTPAATAINGLWTALSNALTSRAGLIT